MQTIRERIEQLHSDCKEALEPKQWRSLIRRAYFTQSKRLAKDFKEYKTGTFEDKTDTLKVSTEKQSEFSVWWKSSGAAEKTIVPLWVTTSTEKQSDCPSAEPSPSPTADGCQGKQSRRKHINIKPHDLHYDLSYALVEEVDTLKNGV